MKGPAIGIRSKVLLGQDDDPPLTPEQMITDFKDEILTAISPDKHEPPSNDAVVPSIFREQPRNRVSDQRNAEIVALYLGRFWNTKNPWWSDEALQVAFRSSLPVTSSAQVAHTEAMELRGRIPARQQGQKFRRFNEQRLKDLVFVQIATMKEAGATLVSASEGMAEWLEWFSKGCDADRKKFELPPPPKRQWTAKTLEREARRWCKDPLKGKLWAEAIAREARDLDEGGREYLRSRLTMRLQAIGPARARLRGEPG